MSLLLLFSGTPSVSPIPLYNIASSGGTPTLSTTGGTPTLATTGGTPTMNTKGPTG